MPRWRMTFEFTIKGKAKRRFSRVVEADTIGEVVEGPAADDFDLLDNVKQEDCIYLGFSVRRVAK